MERQLITKINGIEIFAETSEEGIYIPIKPICSAIGINFSSQYEKLKDDEFLAPTILLSGTVGADGKSREMVSLPLKYIFGWLATINPKNVSSEAKELVMSYRKECYDILFHHFTGRMKKQIEQNREEIKLLKEINDLNAEEKALRSRRKEIDRLLGEIQKERLNPTPSLFD